MAQKKNNAKQDNSITEPELRSEYIKKLKRLKKQKGMPFKNIAELRKIIER